MEESLPDDRPRTSFPVTRPFLPPLEEYSELLRDIWERRWLTNRGHYCSELEKALATFLGVPFVSLFCNGSIALQVGLRALGITGEVITTPFTFAATTHALFWNQCTPVFCDVDPNTGNIDPTKIAPLITSATTAILPVHVYGTPCDIPALQTVADAHGLKLLYDAAHAFGVRIRGESILNSGAISMLSFHATKTFNTAEGGALVTGDPEHKRRIDLLNNHGFADEVTILLPGTNGKMNELQAALGLVQLRYADQAIQARKALSDLYRERLGVVEGIRLLPRLEGVTENYGSMPIFVGPAYPLSRDELYEGLKTRGYYGRRYFYPLTSELPMYLHLPSADRLPVATRLSREVICLPLYPGLPLTIIEDICDTITCPHRNR